MLLSEVFKRTIQATPIALLCALLLPAAQSTEKRLSPLAQVVNQTMEFYFDMPATSHRSINKFIRDLAVSPPYRKTGGVFVTLSQKGKPRACWGTVTPEHANLVEATVYATLGALTKDYRYKPINAHKWRKLKPQVTVITAIVPIAELGSQNPLRDGLMVRAGGKSGVLLPGEVIDATYQLVQCKLKAGIKANESCQLYRLKAEIYE